MIKNLILALKIAIKDNITIFKVVAASLVPLTVDHVLEVSME